MKLTLIDQDEHLTRLRCEGEVSQHLLPHDDLLVAVAGADVYTRCVIISLQGTRFVDTSGINWLLVRHKRFTEAGGRMVLHSIPPLVRQPIQLLRLDRVFTIAATEAEATAVVKGGRG